MPSPIAYSYLRLSTAEQIKGDSVRRQLERSRAYAEKHSLTLDESLRDLAVSAYQGKNREQGALGRFLEHVRTGKVPRGSYLIVESLDRLSREKPRQALQPFLDLIGAGVKIVTLQDEQIYDDERVDAEPWALLVSLTVMMRAHEESKLKSERIGAAWKRKHDRAGDLKVTAKCPGWLRLAADRKRFEIVPEKARAVRLAFELTAKGIGRQKVAAMLNARGAPSPGGTRWYAASLARILKSDAVLGTYQPHEVRGAKRKARGAPLHNYYPAVVNPEIVARARAAMGDWAASETGRIATAGRKGRTYTNLFGGIAFCNECNSPMRLRGRGQRRGDHALICSRRIETTGEPEAHRCRNRSQYQYQSFERDFLRFLDEIDLSIFEEDQDRILTDLMDEVASTKLELNSKRAELERWVTEFGQGEVGVARDRIRELDQVVTALALKVADGDARLGRRRATAMTAKERVLTIGRLQDRMERADGDERYAIRAQLAQELRRIIETIWFGHPACDALVYVHTSRAPDLEPFYALRRYRDGKHVRWECFRMPNKDKMNGLKLRRFMPSSSGLGPKAA